MTPIKTEYRVFVTGVYKKPEVRAIYIDTNKQDQSRFVVWDMHHIKMVELQKSPYFDTPSFQKFSLKYSFLSPFYNNQAELDQLQQKYADPK